jgi:hypothetical protein
MVAEQEDNLLFQEQDITGPEAVPAATLETAADQVQVQVHMLAGQV